MKNQISLNIFTNCTRSAPNTDIIKKTYESFCNTFGEIIPTVYCDPNPMHLKYGSYIDNLYKIFPNIITARSLSDGYVQSIRSGNSDYLFQLEHDWIFNENVGHSLEQIIRLMRENNIYHLRFNKRKNIIAGWDESLEERKAGGIQYCETRILSNNPHIINRKKYQTDLIRKIKVSPGSKGIESEFRNTGYIGAIYGGLNYPATIQHLDARRK